MKAVRKAVIRKGTWALIQCKCKGSQGVCMDGGVLPQCLAIFPANFPIDLSGKLARKIENGNHVIDGHCNWSLSASPQIAITLLYGCWDGWKSED